MFAFAWPWFALLLPLPWLWQRLPPRVAPPPPEPWTLRHPALVHLQAAFGTATGARTARRRLRTSLHGLLWLCLVLALMRPQWLEAVAEVQPWGYDLMLVVDTSCSMEALDFQRQGQQITRMQAIRQILDEFAGQRPSDRIGLVAFGDTAQLVTPLTLDNASVRDAIYNLEPGILGGSTAIGDALGLAFKQLRDRPEGSRVLVLVTDGENTAGELQPEMVMRLAQTYGVRVHVVNVGSDAAQIRYAPERKQHGECANLKDEDNNGFDKNSLSLQKIALLGQGRYFRAADTEALRAISQQIDNLEKTQALATTRWVPRDYYRWPLLLALVPLTLLSLQRHRQAF